MKKFLTIAFLGLAVGALLPGCSKKDGVELKVKWAVGKKYIQHMEMDRNSKAMGNGRPVEQTIAMGSDYAIAVPKVAAGGGSDLDMEFLGQKVLTTMGGRTVASFDSATDPANDAHNPIAPLLRKMTGMHIQYETDMNGRAQKVLDLDAVIDHLGGNTPQGAMLKSRLSEDALKQYVDVGAGLPDHAVRVGDTWSVKTGIPAGPVTMTQDATYTFTGWEEHNGHTCAKLDYTGTIGLKTDNTTAKTAPAMNNGKITGTIWFDAEAGVVIENSSTQNMEVTSTTAPNHTTSAMITQTSDLKLVDITDIK